MPPDVAKPLRGSDIAAAEAPAAAPTRVRVLRRGEGARTKATDAELAFVIVAEDATKRALPTAPRPARSA